MDQYAEIIGESASAEDYQKIALYFDNSGDHFKCGKFFFASKQYEEVGNRLTACFKLSP